ncbi:MAG TPA: squalene/phytoene synthase family protein, partial [Magnetovibrio sp.]
MKAERLMDPEILRLARSRRGPYLAALCAPTQHQDALLALLAFDAELARIADLVSEPMLGRIRLQWWLDALAATKLNGGTGDHPLLGALTSLGLDVQALQCLVELHGFAFDEGVATLAQHEAQAQARGAALAGLMLDVLGVTDETVRAAANDVAGAWAALDAATSARRVASLQDGEALRR